MVTGTAKPALTGWPASRQLLHQPVAVYVFLLLNLVVALLYLWSRHGQTIAVRLEAEGSDFRVLVDGQAVAHASFRDAPDDGGLRIELERSRDNIPSLPSPRGIDELSVRDADTQTVALRDRFDRFDDNAWKLTSPTELSVKGGVLGFSGQVGIAHDEPLPRNAVIDVRFRNITAAGIFVRTTPTGDGVAYQFRPFRHFDGNLILLRGGRIVESVPSAAIRLHRLETLKAFLAIVLRPYPTILLALGAGVLLVFGLSWLPRVRFPRPSLPSLALPALAVFPLIGFAIALHLMVSNGNKMPHVPDEVSYLFEAKLMAAGHLAAPQPPSLKSFSFFYPALISLHEGRWASVYPFGHPLALALGEALGAVWLVPPLVGAATVVALQLFCRKTYGLRTALLAAAMLVFSPFFLMTASNFMSHNTAAFYLMASLVCVAYISEAPLVIAVAGGVFFGLLLNTRPLTAAAMSPAIGVLLLAQLKPWQPSRRSRNRLAGYLCGGLLMLGAYLVYNHGTTGHFTTSGYQASGPVGDTLGFGGQNTFSNGLQNELTQMTFLALVFNGWAARVGCALALLPFLLGTRRLTDWLLLLAAASAMAAYTLFEGNGVMHGPRYWYEAFPLLIVLAARGVEMSGQLIGRVVANLRRGPSALSLDRAGAAYAYVVVLVLVGGGALTWLFGATPRWQVDSVPAQARQLRAFNGVNDGISRAVREAGLRNALVLVEPCSNWQCFGSVFWRDDPDLSNDIVYALDDAGENDATFAAFPDKRVYTASYLPVSLHPFGMADAGTDDPAAAPRAGDLADATKAKLQAVNSAGAAARDEKRRDDLGAVAGLLQAYAAAHGGFPRTGDGVQTLCNYDFDAGCALKEVGTIPHDPKQDASYWLQSDGHEFTVFAAMEAADDRSQCPRPFPSHLASVAKAYCVHGAVPG